MIFIVFNLFLYCKLRWRRERIFCIFFWYLICLLLCKKNIFLWYFENSLKCFLCWLGSKFYVYNLIYYLFIICVIKIIIVLLIWYKISCLKDYNWCKVFFYYCVCLVWMCWNKDIVFFVNWRWMNIKLYILFLVF